MSELNVIRDPMVRAMRTAYKKTDVYRLNELLAEESRWKRKVTIASNKLASVREEINKLARELVADSVLKKGMDEAKCK